MIVTYLLRLLLLCLASFFLVHLALGLVTRFAARAAIGLALRMQPQAGARFLLALRLFPAGFALLVVALICAPSYLWLEPTGTPEPIGMACLALAALGAAGWSLSVGRALLAASRSVRYIRKFRRAGRESRLPGEVSPVWVIEDPAPRVMLAGLIRSQVVISREVIAALSSEQLAAVLRHERAHGRSLDNLKRLLLLLAPGILPFVRGFGALERAWAKVAECAADDRAAAGDSRSSLTLAAALVRVARLGAIPSQPPLVASLMACGLDLEARVDRLLAPTSVATPQAERVRILPSSLALVLGGVLVAAMVHPATLSAAHEVLEALIR